MKVAAILLGSACAGGCQQPDEGRANAWLPGDEEGAGTGVEVDPHDSTTGDGDDKGEAGETGVCSPGESGECLCDDGLHLGTQTCRDDGSDWGPCVCDEDPGGSTGGAEESSGGETGAGDSGGSATEVCYPGADMAYTTCFPVAYPDSPPAGYEYPAPLGGDANYRAPVGYLDLEAIDPEVFVAPNFKLGELAQLSKGRWAVVQVHAVESVQQLRDAVGAITVNSGYRSVDYNAGVGGATYSRHMYGDGFDLDPSSGNLTQLEGECTSIGGMLVEYDTHVHCDFRFDAVDVEFFGAAGEEPGMPAFASAYTASIEHEAGVFTATAQGFDEGEPTRRWTAYDRDGVVLQEALTPVFVAPPGTARVEVEVGRRVEAMLEL